MSRVCVLGLGNMGKAMVRRWVGQGRHVVVWNRTAAVGRALASEAGLEGSVTAHDTAAAAVAAMQPEEPVVLILSTTAAALGVLETVREGFRAKTVVNLTSGNPDDARAIASAASSVGTSDFIDGAYCGGPSKVEAGGGTVFVSADDENIVKPQQKTLECIGEVVYAGPVGASKALDYAVVDMSIATMLFTMASLEMMEKEGVPFDIFTRSAAKRLAAQPAVLKSQYERMKDRTDEGYNTNPAATVETIENFFESRRPYLEKHNLSTSVPDYMIGLLSQLSAAGHGKSDMTRLQELVRFKPSHDSTPKDQ
ncbi:hypothetical protein DIPPA_21798 [Diplonema papillatum]|nr:hypothetical protein DIPPA_21798 [Diplonema papillatum]